LKFLLIRNGGFGFALSFVADESFDEEVNRWIV